MRRIFFFNFKKDFYQWNFVKSHISLNMEYIKAEITPYVLIADIDSIISVFSFNIFSISSFSTHRLFILFLILRIFFFPFLSFFHFFFLFFLYRETRLSKKKKRNEINKQIFRRNHQRSSLLNIHNSKRNLTETKKKKKKT